MKTLTHILIITTFLLSGFSVSAKSPKNPRSKFYDFSEQLIDGQIKKADDSIHRCSRSSQV